MREGVISRITAEDRFWAKVDKTDGCWLWQGIDNGNGYGRFGLYGKSVYAHRFAYELLVGPIPEGLHLDHLCRVRLCVRPSHLEAVTQVENNRRAPRPKRTRLHCPRGHLKDGIRSDGGFFCRECNRRSAREYQRRRKGIPPERFRIT
jgi:hypothetical protein